MPKLLDLFCGAGGAAMGYARAGFDVTGVDIKPQPHYPFAFIQADALTFELSGYDVVHASPPCQHYSSLARLHPGKTYPNVVPQVREMLRFCGVPWILENVMGAPLPGAITICGTALGLRIKRHRAFESSELLFAPGPCRHSEQDIAVTGHSVVYSWHSARRRSPHLGWARAREVMGIEWATWESLSQAIPPAYTEWLGRQLMSTHYAKSAG